MKIKVGVIFGGDSVEHEVSIITAVQAMEYMDTTKYEIIPIYIDKNRNWYTGNALLNMETFQDLSKVSFKTTHVCLTKKENDFILVNLQSTFKKVVSTIDVAFPIVHGKGVEDGSLMGYLDTLGIPYVGCDIIGASLGQDKVLQKQVLKACNVSVPNFIWFYENEYFENSFEILKQIQTLGYPVIVKPARLGSSVGIQVVKSEETIKQAIEEAILYDEKIIVEEVIPNLMEVDIAVLGNHESMEVSEIGEMLTNHDFLTFEDKYIGEGKKKAPSKSSKTDSNSGFRIPANLEKKVEEEIIATAKQAFLALNLKGVTRFDFLIDQKSQKVYVNEPNTIPGCLAFFFFTPKNITYTDLLDRLITLTIKDYKNSQKKISSFESNVLSTFQGSKGAKNKLKKES